MSRRRGGPLLALLVAALLSACATAGGRSHAAPAVPRATAGGLRRGNDAFAGRVLTATPPSTNLVLSPFSISQALAMIDPAAHGATGRQLASALDFSLPPAQLASAFAALNADLAGANRSGVALDVADAVYGQRGFPFRPAYLSELASSFGAPLQTVDFAGAPGAATTSINHWVATETHGHIADLFRPADIDSTTRLVLVDAVYLDASWQTPFAHGATTPAAFHAPSGTVRVATMHGEGGFPYARHPGYAVAELPYVGGRLAFDVLLPDRGRLPTLLPRLRRIGPAAVLTGLRTAPLAVALPKLTLRTHLELRATLRSLGLRRAFIPGQADLSGAGGRPGDLFISAIEHAAYLRVDEAGTEAAAATGGSISATAVLRTTPFAVDRPFVYLLRDRRTGAVLFAGIVRRP